MRNKVKITYAIIGHKYSWNKNSLDEFGNILIKNVTYWWCGTKGWLKDDGWAIVKKNKKEILPLLKNAQQKHNGLLDIHIVKIATTTTEEFFRA